MTELKPCPRCKVTKAKWDVEFDSDTDEPMNSIICLQCRYQGPIRTTEQLAYEAWNALDRTDYRALAAGLATALTNTVAICYAMENEGASSLVKAVMDECGATAALAHAHEAKVIA